MIFLFLIPLIHSSASSLDNCNGIGERQVTKELFRNQNGTGSYWDRPVRDFNKPVHVDILVWVNSLSEIVERTDDVYLGVTLEMNWYDEIHVWNETKPLNCTDYVVLPHHNEQTPFWMPTVMITNSDDPYALTAVGEEKIRIYSNGKSIYSSTKILQFKCSFDISAFPFDESRCNIHIEAARYKMGQQVLHGAMFTFERFKYNGQWHVHLGNMTDSSFTYAFKIATFSFIDFEILFKRKHAFNILAYICPIAFIAVTELASFSLPKDSGARLEISFTCLLSFTFFISMIQNHLPHCSENPPFLLIYVCLVSGTISLVALLQSATIFLLRNQVNKFNFESNLIKRLATICNYLAIFIFTFVLFVGFLIMSCLFATYRSK